MTALEEAAQDFESAAHKLLNEIEETIAAARRDKQETRELLDDLDARLNALYGSGVLHVENAGW